MVTQHASLGSITCMYACFRGATYDSRTELELEYLFGIDCTPVSLRFFQEFEPYDPWHWSLSCSESSSRAAARLWRPLPRNGKGRRANEEVSASGAREFLLDDKPFSSHKGTVKANKNRSVCLAAITLDVAMKLQRTVGKFDIWGKCSLYCKHRFCHCCVSQANNFISHFWWYLCLNIISNLAQLLQNILSLFLARVICVTNLNISLLNVYVSE